MVPIIASRQPTLSVASLSLADQDRDAGALRISLATLRLAQDNPMVC